MRRLIVLAVLLLGALPLLAQIRAPRASVTSLGPNGELSPAPPASVNSLGPFGFYTPRAFRVPTYNLHGRLGNRRRFDGRFTNGIFGYGGFNSYPLVAPYYTPAPAYPLLYPMMALSPGDAEDESAVAAYSLLQRQRRQLEDELAATRHVAQPPTAGQSAAAVQAAAAPPPEAAEQQPTLLVFRDGHRLEVKNYAIVGKQLYNFSGTGPRKIDLAELDLPATTRANDDRGVEFRLPPGE